MEQERSIVEIVANKDLYTTEHAVVQLLLFELSVEKRNYSLMPVSELKLLDFARRLLDSVR